jgi:hydrogenase maturation factor/phosphoheptose isomerase
MDVEPGERVIPADAVLPYGAATELATAALTLARRFWGGGTLWCVSPGSAHHAQHVAVEFVHPVIMGARALPAMAVLDDDVTGALRSVARAGDVLLVVSGHVDASQQASLANALRRANIWGLTTIWMATHALPDGGSADHQLCLATDQGAERDGQLVLGYHLLWELTQVCFEHPGLLSQPDAGPICVTCGDEGRVAEVLAHHDDEATVRTAQGIETVNTALVGSVRSGDLVLVHAGVAIDLVEP